MPKHFFDRQGKKHKHSLSYYGEAFQQWISEKAKEEGKVVFSSLLNNKIHN